MNARYLLAAVIIATVALAFHAFTLRTGQTWDGDYALYIMQARNVASGDPAADTHYIFNPENAIHPELYPPGLPILLAPVYALAGVDFEAMKWVGLLAWAGFVLVFARIAREYLPPRLALAGVGLIALHPYVWEIKDTIYAELPFLLFLYVALVLSDRLGEERARSRRWWLAAGLALTVSLACLTRTVGVLLFPVIGAAAVLRARGFPRREEVAAVAAAMLVIAGSRYWFPSDPGTYFSYFENFSVRGLVWAARDYAWSTGSLIQSTVLPWTTLERALTAGFFGLAAIGILARLRQRISVYDVFLVAYGAFLLIYPIRYEPVRYAMPIWPLLMLCALRGAEVLGGLLRATSQRFVPATICVAMLAAFIAEYSMKAYGPIENSVTDERAMEMFESVQRLVPTGAVLLARKPTILGLFTQRAAASWPRDFESDEEFWAYAHQIGADYLVYDVYQFGDGEFDPEDRLIDFVRDNRRHLDLVFRNEWFRVFEFRPECAAGDASCLVAPAESSGSRGLNR